MTPEREQGIPGQDDGHREERQAGSHGTCLGKGRYLPGERLD